MKKTLPGKRSEEADGMKKMLSFMSHPSSLIPALPARFAFVLALAAAGLILLVRTAIPAALLAGIQDEGAEACSVCLTGDQFVSSSGSLQQVLAQSDVIPT